MERKEPTLSGIVPDSDDAPAGAQRPTKRQGTVEPPPVDDGDSGPGFVAIVALIVAIAGVGGSGFLAWQLNQSRENLVAAQNQIDDLQSRMDLNSDQSSETVTEIRDKLEWADSEIRKLWGVSHDTNRSNIKANKESIASLERQVSEAADDASAARSAISSVESDLTARVSELETQLAEASSAVAELKSSARTLESLQTDVQDLSERVPQLSDLASRVQTNEEAITAIDAYRRSVNRDILQLKERIGQLRSSGGTTSP